MVSLNPLMPVIGLSCLLFFVGWLVARRVDTLQEIFDSLVGAGVAFGALLISPFFFYATWHQVGAKERLVREQVPVSADLGYAIGAQGGRAPRGVWRFEARTNPQAILAYYETQAQATGWKTERTKPALLLHKPGVTFALWTEQHGDEAQIIIEKRIPPPGK